MTTSEDIFNQGLMDDSEYYAEYGYCITPEELMKEANNSIIKLRKALRDIELLILSLSDVNKYENKVREIAHKALNEA